MRRNKRTQKGEPPFFWGNLGSLEDDKDPLSGRAGCHCRKYELPGVTAAYALPEGQVVELASGLADKESHANMSPDTRVLAGSVGKTFVAAMTLALAQQGKLSLDDVNHDSLA